jgi:hypothetical protein
LFYSAPKMHSRLSFTEVLHLRDYWARPKAQWPRTQDGRLAMPDLGTSLSAQFKAAGTIIHECTHAGFDLLKVPNMTNTQHEAGAYVAEAMYQIAKMVQMGGDPTKVVMPSTSPIQGAAWDIALLTNKGKASWSSWTPDFAIESIQAVSRLFVAIMTDSTYAATAKDIVKNDGVGRPWKQPSR